MVEILGAFSKGKVLITYRYPLNDACIQDDVTLDSCKIVRKGLRNNYQGGGDLKN